MITATGNINRDYDVIGVVHATVVKTAKKKGCGGAGGLPIEEAYRSATRMLAEAAHNSGGDAVIHIGYDHRVSASPIGCAGSAEPAFEVYAWGTAVKLK